MKLFVSLAAFVSFSTSVLAFPSFDPFTDATGSGGTSYADGATLYHQTNALGEGWAKWNGGNAGSSVHCVSSNLNYLDFPAGFPATPAKSVFLPGTVAASGGVAGQSAALTFSRVVKADTNNLVTNAIYASFLMQIPHLGNLSSGAIYFGGFATNAVEPTGTLALPTSAMKLFLKGNSAAGTSTEWTIGVANNSGGGSGAYDAGGHTSNDVLFVVVDYEFGINGGADFTRMWVNPVSSDFGASVPPTPTASTAGFTTAATRIAQAANFYLLDRTGGTLWGSMVIGDLRVGTTWSYVTGGPEIIIPPTSITNPPLSTANFQVKAISGSDISPLIYQWQKDGVDLSDDGHISGSTTTNLSISNASASDNGTYSIIVANTLGAVTNSATLIVQTDPFILVQPVDFTGATLGTANFSIAATGTPTLTYQWQKNGGNISDGPTGFGSTISGSTSTNLTISNLALDDGGDYSVIVKNGLNNTVSSSNAVLTVTNAEPLEIVSPLQSRVERVGDNTAFAIGVSGTMPTFTWFHNDVLIGGATSYSLPLTNIQADSAGNYTVIANNQLNSITNTATLTVSNGLFHLSAANLVVARVGNGAEILNTTLGNTLYLDSFDTNGTYLNTIMIPNSGVNALVVAGGVPDGLVESVLTRSVNQQQLNFVGFNLTLPNTNGTFQGSIIPRAIGAVNGLGYYAVALTNSGLYSGGAQVRSAVSTDGLIDFWTTGSGGGGIKYLTPANGAAGIPQPIGAADPRVVEIFNDQLYFTEGNGGAPTQQAGLIRFDGLPTTATSVSGVLTADPNASNPNDLAFSPDGSTIYIADNNNLDSNGGIQRWENGGLSYILNTAAISPAGASGLTVDFSNFAEGTGAVIYATIATSSGNQLVRIVDNGSDSTATILATAGVNQLFRGIRFAPIQVPVSIATQPQDRSVLVGGSATFSVNAAGDAPFTYQWFFNGTNISGATGRTLVLTNLQLTNAGNYSVVVSNDISFALSSDAELQVSVFNPNNNLAAYLRMDETTGLIAADSSGNGNNGALNSFIGDDSQWVSGRVNGALKFISDNTNANVVLIPDSPTLNFSASRAFTVAAWVKGPATQFSGASLITKGTGNGGEQFDLDVYNGSLRFFVRSGSGTTAGFTSTNQPMNGRWQHVAATVDSDQGFIRLYVNGQLIGTNAAPSTLLSSSHEVSIGNRQSSSTSDYNFPFNGAIDDVRIYNVALSLADVQTLYGTAGGLAPLFYVQPVGATNFAGTSVTFSPLVDGTDPLMYQWKKDGANVSGATNLTLTITNLQPTNAGSYTLAVTNGINPPALSSPAVLQVLFTAFSSVLQSGNDSIQISGTGPANGTFTILSSTDIALPFDQWIVAATGSCDANGQFTVLQTTTNAPTKFFVISTP